MRTVEVPQWLESCLHSGNIRCVIEVELFSFLSDKDLFAEIYRRGAIQWQKVGPKLTTDSPSALLRPAAPVLFTVDENSFIWCRSQSIKGCDWHITKGSLGYLSSMYFSTSLVLGEVDVPFPEIETRESRTET